VDQLIGKGRCFPAEGHAPGQIGPDSKAAALQKAGQAPGRVSERDPRERGVRETQGFGPEQSQADHADRDRAGHAADRREPAQRCLRSRKKRVEQRAPAVSAGDGEQRTETALPKGETGSNHPGEDEHDGEHESDLLIDHRLLDQSNDHVRALPRFPGLELTGMRRISFPEGERTRL